jgi:hypothetical protein
MAKKKTQANEFLGKSSAELADLYDPDWPLLTRIRFEETAKEHEEPLDSRHHRYLEADPMFGYLLKHPLYRGHLSDPSHGCYENAIILMQQRTLDKLVAEGQWLDALRIHIPQFHLQAFRKYEKHFDDKAFWELLTAIWVTQEQLWPNRKAFLQLFQSNRPKRDCLMTASERRKIDTLPDRFPIYRGFIGKRGEGLSWTIDRTTAIWFASRFAVVEQFGKPKLIEGVARKKDVLAYFNSRKEKEIIINPAKVTKQVVTKIPYEPSQSQ